MSGSETLMVQIDNEYMIFNNVSLRVEIIRDAVARQTPHTVRVIVPLINNLNDQVFHISGFWLDKGSNLLPVANVQIPDLSPSDPEAADDSTAITEEELVGRKMLEIVSDSGGSHLRRKDGQSRHSHDILEFVKSWQYLLGEMFGADHMTAGIEGMCLIEDCVGAVGSPMGIGDVYFRR
jgi:hypothetical protein